MKKPPTTSVAKTRNILEITRANPTPQACADHEPEERERQLPSYAGTDRRNPHPHTCYTLAGAPPPSCCSLCSHYDHTRSAAWAYHASQLQHFLQTARHHYNGSWCPCFFARQQRPFTKTNSSDHRPAHYAIILSPNAITLTPAAAVRLLPSCPS